MSFCGAAAVNADSVLHPGVLQLDWVVGFGVLWSPNDRCRIVSFIKIQTAPAWPGQLSCISIRTQDSGLCSSATTRPGHSATATASSASAPNWAENAFVKRLKLPAAKRAALWPRRWFHFLALLFAIDAIHKKTKKTTKWKRNDTKCCKMQ